MPPARHAATTSSPDRTAARASRASRSRRPHVKAASTRAGRAGARVRWDRVARMALGAVLCVVGALYVQHAVAWFSSRSAYQHAHSSVVSLQRSNAALQRQEKAFRNPATILRDARRLGMVRPGERPYVLSGVPSQ